VAVWLVTLAMLFFTDWAVSGVVPLANHGVKLTYGPAMWVVLGMFFVGTARNLAFLLLAYRRARNPVFREFVGLNLIAFHTILAPAIWLLFILPVFGLGTQVFAYLAFPVSVMLFNIAIVRYQFGQHRELHESLEQKVEDRTEELRQTQVRLAQSERMASLGQLVAGVAHEMNNPVGAVRSIAGSLTSAVARLKQQRSDGTVDVQQMDRLFEVVDDAGRVIDEGTRKITRVVDDLKSFARLDAADLQRTDINKELEDTVALLEPVLKPSVKVRKDLGEVPDVLCYPAELNQVMLNLLVNANEAIGDGGVIVVGTRSRKQIVRITVKDTGKGISPDYLEKVFEPGFTTKGRGVGTGLGLAICYQIVRDHDGEIRVASEEGSGTTFTIELPVAGPGRRD
jgi:signal transduction histidine kinase